MEVNNPVIQLCISDTQSEFRQNIAEAIAFYEQAWEIHSDDFNACIAAHYMARYQKDAKVEFDLMVIWQRFVSVALMKQTLLLVI
jgi:hypothetical protein